jgi:glycosyltransferase involved in cell wall biosynthesis
MNNKPSICLNMIVKNESKIITRCLDSVKDIIDYWIISDTGSTDGTQQIISDYFAQHGIDGVLMEHEWKNFAHNRNLALNPALGKTDYILIMDADDYLITFPDFQLPPLTAGSYMLKIRRSDTLYYNTKLIRADLPWRWEGVLHEYLTCDVPHTSETLEGNCLIASTTDGARSQNPDKYRHDAEVLEAALLEEPNNTRYRFYLAQSYRDAKDYNKAIEHYQLRVNMGGWEEEVYRSLLDIAHAKHILGEPLLDVIRAYIDAHCYRPQRLEALYYAVKLCREQAFYSLGCQLGWEARHTPMTDDVLFVEKSVYSWQFLDELSVCAVYAHKKSEAADIMRQLLASLLTPPNQYPRLRANLDFACS